MPHLAGGNGMKLEAKGMVFSGGRVASEPDQVGHSAVFRGSGRVIRSRAGERV